MCIDSIIHREPLDVMSTDDSDVLPPSSTNLSVDTFPTTSHTSTTMKSQDPKTVASSQPEILGSSVDTIDTTQKGSSQISLSSLSESNDDTKLTRFEVTSVDAISLEGELNEKREHANSAFAIMSIEQDLDTSSLHVRNPTSADEPLRNISKAESGSEEETTASLPVVVNESIPTTTHEVHTLTGNTDLGVASNLGNGTSVQPGTSRFKRVNMYVRERWTVRDHTAQDSQKDPKNPQKLQDGVISPATSRKTNSEYSEQTLESGSTSEFGALSSGSGMLAEAGSEKEGTGSLIDKSSTAAESTPSRKSSFSSENFDAESVVSASGSTVGRDRDTPEISHGAQQGNSAQLPFPIPQHTSQPLVADTTIPTPVYTTQSLHPTHPTTSVMAAPMTAVYTTQPPTQQLSRTTFTSSAGPVMTQLSREESATVAGSHGPNSSSESSTESRERQSFSARSIKEGTRKPPVSVISAMTTLQSELDRLVENNGELEHKNSQLTEENKRLKESSQKLKEDNVKLKNELEKLRKALAIMVTTDDSGSNLGDTSMSHGTT